MTPSPPGVSLRGGMSSILQYGMGPLPLIPLDMVRCASVADGDSPAPNPLAALASLPPPVAAFRCSDRWDAEVRRTPETSCLVNQQERWEEITDASVTIDGAHPLG
jgi:hypothetical protein